MLITLEQLLLSVDAASLDERGSAFSQNVFRGASVHDRVANEGEHIPGIQESVAR